MSPTTVLISGANRGLGQALLKRYLALDNHVVIAANRNPQHPTSLALNNLPRGKDSKLIVVKVDATVHSDPAAAVAELQAKHGVEKLDVVIANAGVSYTLPSVAEAKLEDIKAHFEPNVYGVVALYQATRSLLQKSEREPMFIPIGSSAGCIPNQLPIPNACYGPTKAALNWYIVRINSEDEWLNAFTADPGLVDTELGRSGAEFLGIAEHCIPIDTSCDGMMDVFLSSSKEKHGGKMIGYDGEVRGF